MKLDLSVTQRSGKEWKGKKGINITRKQGKRTDRKEVKKYQHGKGREKI
jgi:hypothetical protein